MVAVALLLPTAVALETRWRVVDQSGTVWIHDWLDEAFTSIEPNGVVVFLVVLLDAAVVRPLVEGRRPDSRSSTTGPASTRTSAP